MKKMITKTAAVAALVTTMAANSTVTVFAENSIPVDSTAEKAKNSMDEAKAVLEQAKEDVAVAETHVKETEMKAVEAQTAVDQANQELEEAKKALETAKANLITEEDVKEAEQAVAEKEAALTEAKTNAESAKGEYLDASAAYNNSLVGLDQAQKTFDEAETAYNNAAEAEQAANAIVGDLSDEKEVTEAELAEAESAEEAAKDSLDTIETENSTAEADLKTKNEEVTAATEDLDAKKQEYQAKMDAADEAEQTLNDAKTDVEHAEADVKQTESVVEEKNVALEEAVTNRETAEVLADPSSEAFQAEKVAREEAKTAADTALQNAESERTAAEKNLAEKEEELATAETAKTDAESALAEAKQALADKEAEIEELEQTVSDKNDALDQINAKKGELSAAKDAYDCALAEKQQADAALAEKQADVATAQGNVDAKQAAVDAAQEAYNDALAAKAVTVIDFYDHMYEQTGEMDWKIAGEALKYYNEQAAAAAGNGVSTGVTDSTDPNDAVALELVLRAVDFIDQGNSIRANLGLNTLKVSPILMAMSEAMVNMSAEITTHWRFDGKWTGGGLFRNDRGGGEIFAAGFDDDPSESPIDVNGNSLVKDEYGNVISSNPYSGWYAHEKEVYDYCKDVLKMPEEEITQENVQNLPYEDLRNLYCHVTGNTVDMVGDISVSSMLGTVQVGHYLNVINENFTCTGFGVVHRWDPQPEYWLFMSSGVELQISSGGVFYYDENGRPVFTNTYTTDEYRELLNQFITYSAEAKNNALKALEAAQAELEAAKQALIFAEGDRDEAKRVVEMKQAAVDTALANYEAVSESAEQLMTEIAETYPISSTPELTQADIAEQLNNMVDRLSASIGDDMAALNTLDTTVETQSVNAAEEDLRAALNRVSDLSDERVSLETALATAEAEVAEKQAAVDTAQARIEELNQSLEQAIENLRVAQAAEALAQEEYDVALADHQTALNTLDALSDALTRARDAKDRAEQAKADALDAKNAAEAILENLTEERDALEDVVAQILSARNTAANATAEVNRLTTKVTDLTSALAEAETVHNNAVTVLRNAADDLSSAKAVLHAASSAAEATETVKAKAEAKYNTAVLALENAEKALEEARNAIPTVTDLVPLEKAVTDAQALVDKAETALADANDAYAKALSDEKAARETLAEALKSYEAIEASSFRIEDAALKNLDQATADQIQESSKDITIKVTEDFIDYSKVGEGFTAENSTTAVSLGLKLTSASMKDKGSRSLTYDISPEVVFSNGTTIVKGELNDYLNKTGVEITVTLPMNGLDVREIVHKHGTDTDYIYSFTKDEAADTITFTVDQFSTFTLNETPVNPSYGSDHRSDPTGTVTAGNPVPDTADPTSLGATAMVLLSSLAFVSYSVMKRRNDGKED